MPAVKNTRQTRFAPVGVGGIVAGMKTTFIALLAFSLCLPLMGADKKPLIADPIVEEQIRTQLEKPTGELTKADLEKVKRFGLSRSQITDAGLKEVAKLRQLQHLVLWQTQTTDAGLKEVAELENLTELHIAYTKVTDVGLKELAKLKKLTKLNLRSTKVTKAGVAELQKVFPKCDIVSNPRK